MQHGHLLRLDNPHRHFSVFEPKGGCNATAAEHGVEAMVEVELSDGALHRLESISAEPGFGFVTLRPHTAEGPQELIVPLGAIRQLTIGAAEPEHRIGFSLPPT